MSTSSSSLPAFSASIPLYSHSTFHATCSHHVASFHTRHRNAVLSSSRRRRPRPSYLLTAVFIWSSHYENSLPEDENNEDDPESSEHTDDIEESNSDIFASKNQDDESLWGDVWNKSKNEKSSVFNTSDSSQSQHTNILCDALYRHTSGPDDVDGLKTIASDSAADAFRTIVHGILGTLPGDAYEIVITSDRTGVSRLMQSSLATGYALRNAEFRMLLNETMSDTTAHQKTSMNNDSGNNNDDVTSSSDSVINQNGIFTSEPDYMKSVPRRGMVNTSQIQGTVRWWDGEKQTYNEISSKDYVAKLEAENELLRERLEATRVHDSNNNRLLDFMRTLSPEKIANLQANLSSEALEAFKYVVKSVLGDLNAGKVQMTYSTTRDYLGQVTFWCLMVGYVLRNIEKRMEMTRAFEQTTSYAESISKESDS